MSKSLVGFIAHCLDCDWEEDDYLTGQRKASVHASNNGHTVSAEATYAVTYGGMRDDN